MKKVLVTILLVSMFSTLFVNSTNIEIKEINTEQTIETDEEQLNAILSEYYLVINNIKQIEQTGEVTSKIIKTIEDVQENTVSNLKDLGYEAYNVTPDTFYDVESSLSTDLSDINLDPQSSYIIVLHSEKNNSIVDSSLSRSSTFTHNYNGTNYTMRYMTVASGEDPIMSKATRTNLLTSSSQELINNLLNTMVNVVISSVSSELGTIASICGLDITDFEPQGNSIIDLYAATNWSRVYTQVLDENSNIWYSGSSTEYAEVSSYIAGYNYTSTGSRPIPQSIEEDILYSDEYFDATWRRDKGVLGYLIGYIQYDTTGNVEYKVGNTTEITHYQNF